MLQVSYFLVYPVQYSASTEGKWPIVLLLKEEMVDRRNMMLFQEIQRFFAKGRWGCFSSLISEGLTIVQFLEWNGV